MGKFTGNLQYSFNPILSSWTPQKIRVTILSHKLEAVVILRNEETKLIDTCQWLKKNTGRRHVRSRTSLVNDYS